MLTVEIFDERVEALWASQKRMAAPKKWHSGRRAGMVRTPALPIQFRKPDLRAWLWQKVGLNAVACPYCGVPIDILSLTLDHIFPRSAGGAFALDNTAVICRDCNERKGNLTHEAFTALLAFARENLSGYDQGVLLARLKAAHAGSANRFFRDKARNHDSSPARPQRPVRKAPAQPQLEEWF